MGVRVIDIIHTCRDVKVDPTFKYISVTEAMNAVGLMYHAYPPSTNKSKTHAIDDT